MPIINVKSRIIGASSSDVALSDIALDLLHEQISIEDLIRLTVEEQIHDLLVKRKLNAEAAQEALKRQYLTSEEIQDQAKSGAIRIHPPAPPALPTIDSQIEIRNAVEAFRQKTYLIIIDGYQPERLDEIVRLHSTSKITFLRLTPLRGG